MTMRRVVVLGLIALVGASLAEAAPNAPQRVHAFAALPDWTGLWDTEASRAVNRLNGKPDGNEFAAINKSVQLFGPAPYTEVWGKKLQAALSNPAAAIAASNAKLCTYGLPMIMDMFQLFQVVVTPEETLFVFDNGEVRHVYTDGRRHPAKDDLWPTAMGDSVGHWEGETLVIDTVALTEGSLRIGPNSLSAQAHFTERVRRRDKNNLEDQMTIDDPGAFMHPWKLTFHYTRAADLDRMLPWDCSNDRNPVVDGKLTVAPP
jgi:hypothetical protein